MIAFLRPGLKALEDVEVRIREDSLSHCPLLNTRTLEHRSTPPVLATQQAAGQREVGKISQAKLGTDRQDLNLVAALKQAVVILNANEVRALSRVHFGLA